MGAGTFPPSFCFGGFGRVSSDGERPRERLLPPELLLLELFELFELLGELLRFGGAVSRSSLVFGVTIFPFNRVGISEPENLLLPTGGTGFVLNHPVPVNAARVLSVLGLVALECPGTARGGRRGYRY